MEEALEYYLNQAKRAKYYGIGVAAFDNIFLMNLEDYICMACGKWNVIPGGKTVLCYTTTYSIKGNYIVIPLHKLLYECGHCNTIYERS